MKLVTTLATLVTAPHEMGWSWMARRRQERSRRWASAGKGEVINRDVAGGEDVSDWATVEPTNNHAWREPFGENKAYFGNFLFFIFYFF
jgi:hypothetical protein